MATHNHYPALLLDWLTPVYDLFARLFFPEGKIKRGLVAQARISPGDRILDAGAGTGTLAILVKQAHPKALVTGIDGDLRILAVAREKAARAGVEVAFDLGNLVSLPYPNGSFDRILSSLVFSLLSREDKQLALREASRVLRSNGELHIADFGPPHTWWGRWLTPLMRRFEPISDHLDGLLPVMVREAGFENVVETARYATVFGTLSLLQGRKPECKASYT